MVSGAGKPRVWFIDQFDEIALRTDANDLLVVEDDGEDAGGSDHDGDRGVIVFHAQRVSLFVAWEHHVFSLTPAGPGYSPVRCSPSSETAALTSIGGSPTLSAHSCRTVHSAENGFRALVKE